MEFVNAKEKTLDSEITNTSSVQAQSDIHAAPSPSNFN